MPLNRRIAVAIQTLQPVTTDVLLRELLLTFESLEGVTPTPYVLAANCLACSHDAKRATHGGVYAAVGDYRGACQPLQRHRHSSAPRVQRAGRTSVNPGYLAHGTIHSFLSRRRGRCGQDIKTK